MKVKVKKDLTLEELFENKGLSWEETMNFLKMIKYGDKENETFETIYGKENNCKTLLDGEEYLVNKNVFNVVVEEDKKIERHDYQYSLCPEWFRGKEIIRVMNENFETHQKAIYMLIDEVNKLKEEK